MPQQSITFDNKDLSDIIRQHLYQQGLEPASHFFIHIAEPDRPSDKQEISVTVTVRPVRQSSPPAMLQDPRNGY